MEQSTGAWLAAQIQAHQTTLAETLAATTQAQLPFYRDWDRARLATGIAVYFATLAEVCARGEMEPMRLYMERVTAERLRQGAGGMDYIWMLGQSEAQLRALVAQQAPPARRAEAERLVRTTHRQIGLLISAINLRTLQEPGTGAPAS
ncbi:MAG TPA: hypothetical protein VKY74_25190 [Chloroflexia bacterium]|nr:hypothetical protein [Chloroflexia bacterium]